MSYEPLHHKYRPQTFADLVGQEAIATTLSFAIKQKKIAPAYLFTGPRGTGKTSSARILAKSLNCLSSDRPTPSPCGKCEVCQAISNGSALDVMEIDAASNTGVDNIREIIERCQFAPVQSRYKVYAIDECLTGDSLIKTNTGLVRIDDPKIKDKLVLSYNENTQAWEYKKVLRWLERGTKETLVIKTSNHLIRCTKNHLIRTDKGWIEAGNVKEGMKILSPVNADAESISTNMAQMEEYADFHQDISLKATNNTPQWTTNLEKVEFVSHDGYEKVYDLEVEDNHNFVANGLLVHNCHMLSTAAFNALLKTLEEPPNRVVFVLATTDPQRVLSTIISRCQRFDFRRIPLAAMVSHLKYIATQEKINITDEAITLVAQIANGGLRDAESLLDQLSLLPEIITIEQVWDLVGSVPEQDLLALLRAIASTRPEAVIDRCRKLLDRGREPLVVLQNLAGFYLNLLIAKTAPDRPDLTAVTETTWQNLCTLAQSWHISEILRGQQHLKDAEVQIKNTTQPRLWLEVTLLGLLSLSSEEDRENKEGREDRGDKEDGEDRVLSSPQAKVKPPEFNPVTNPKQSESISSDRQTSSSHNLTSTPANSTPSPIKNVISPNSEPRIPNPETQNPKPELPKVPPQEVWKKAIEHLQPPATQALFKQKCHLISLEGSVAIVGTIAPQLLKLNQGKIPNLEAAFAKVCQRTIKVKLEASTAESSVITSVAPSVQSPPAQTPVSPAVSHTSTTSSAEFKESSPATPEKKTLTPEINTNSHTSVELNQEREKTHLKEEKPKRVIPLKENSDEISKPTELLPVKSNLEINNVSAENITQNYNSSTSDEKLQQAIETLAKNFEGEIVTLAGAIDDETEKTDLEESESDRLLAPKDNNSALEHQLEDLSTQELEINHKSSSTNQSTPKPPLILHNRPDLSKYDNEDDVPF
ncbi:MAG: DNA polymerase III subunit gamma/tau [Xenococcaceae cyanobacterium MO_188.B32]|nr:DNA polymerase III subunit gamma/tau [Xenococcaceae cyanobacterium MO_188.B32]